MIVAKRKPFAEIWAAVRGVTRVLVVGCRECVTVCQAGGEKEVKILALMLKMAGKKAGIACDVTTAVLHRQCDHGFLPELDRKMDRAEICISLGCGVGVQFIAERYPAKPVFPGVDTLFAGGTVAPGIYEEMCAMCGECMLAETGGICPMARCAKGLLNGPCGGSVNGVCEVSPDIPCAWDLIYQRLKAQGRLSALERIHPPKNWALSGSGGLRRVIREEVAQ